MAGRKFYASTSTTILLSVAAFILLSDCIDARQCYWCGPLAEQVHRSRRAPPCDAPKAHVTSCDKDFPHCAVVATAPPYVESRYCVKTYQDECYLNFCNTSKTFIMTCPCKGDLCNGQNSDREEEAFAELIEKSQNTLKKRTKKDIKEPLLTRNLYTIQTEENKIAMIYPNVSEIETSSLNKASVNENESVTEIHVYDNPYLAPEKQLSEKDQHEDEIITPTEQIKKSLNLSELKETFEIGTTSYVLESTAIEITDIKIDKNLAESLINPSEELPTAEALQQSKSSDVANENEEIQTTISDELSITTIEASEITTEHPSSRQNEAVNIKTNIYLFILLIYICSIQLLI